MQFMARKLLKSFGPEPSNFTHQPHHDLESWVYVIVYAVMKRECLALDVKSKHESRHIKATMKAQLKQMLTIFYQTFGSSTTGRFSPLARAWPMTGSRTRPSQWARTRIHRFCTT
jgi:hypothetical protein